LDTLALQNHFDQQLNSRHYSACDARAR
jgi:hypothetical protein